ncbi:MAG: adenylate/guanylate cyclase domain-containing protein [Desulfobacterales bacterium]
METEILQIKEELEKRVFHLKALCDISSALTEIGKPEQIIRKFLLMAMGNFGTRQGFVLVQDSRAHTPLYFVDVGFSKENRRHLEKFGGHILTFPDVGETPDSASALTDDRIACVVPFSVDDDVKGVVAFGPKLLKAPFGEEDRELLTTLVNNLSISLRNAQWFENAQQLNQVLKEKNVQLEEAMDELDRRVYHLKTLYDVSKSIFESVESQRILREFLLMTMGSFGILRGFVGISNGKKGELAYLEAAGFEEKSLERVKSGLLRIFDSSTIHWSSEKECFLESPQDLPHGACFGMTFCVEEGCYGFLGMGEKLLPGPFADHEQELLTTLVNSLSIAFRNARAFERIQTLNRDLQAALRKVELLESIKANLCRFVPNTVTRLVEKSPTDEVLDARERDISVLFLDIEGYTKITERIGATAVNQLIETYFSGFMEAIYENNGDILETSGDGLMVLFLTEDETTHAMEALQAAAAIRDNTLRINQESQSEPVFVNLGICSGPAFVGAAKFDSLTGSRWAYTSHGNTVNIAARICSVAKKGQLLVARSTVERVKSRFPFTSLGYFPLKNVSEEVEIFSLDDH